MSADTWTGTDLEWWEDLERRWFGGQTQTEEQREALVGEMILQGKAAEQKYDALKNVVLRLLPHIDGLAEEGVWGSAQIDALFSFADAVRAHPGNRGGNMSSGDAQRRMLIEALVGQKHRTAYLTNSTLYYALNSLADLLPLWVDGLAAHAETVSADLQKKLQEMMSPAHDAPLPRREG